MEEVAEVVEAGIFGFHLDRRWRTWVQRQWFSDVKAVIFKMWQKGSS
jgi:hypothetical protein